MPFPESSFARSGRFSEIRPIGRGAVGQVYAAVDNLGRRVAVKEALPTAEGFAVFSTKFEKESRLQAALDHPNIVRVYHLEEDGETGELYLICEYADGGSLAELIEREGPLPEARAMTLALDICAALEETERLRIVHRDLKPSNILLFTQPGGGLTAKLGDFGIAQDARQRKTTVFPGTSHPGTPLYMAPEQADATLILDTRADIYALGITLWEMLTREDYKALLRDAARPTLQTYVPATSAGIGQVIARAVHSDREERYESPRQLADDLRRVLHGDRPAPETLRMVSPTRRPREALTLWRGGLAPLVVTGVLLVGSIVATAALAGVTGLLTGWTTRPPLLSALQPTAVPPGGPFEPTVPPPTATPIERSAATLDLAVGSAVAATATAVAIPTPWVDGTAMAGPNGCPQGSGLVVSQARPVAPFSAIELQGMGTAIVRQGEAEALTIEADDNLQQMIYSYVEDDTLYIGLHGCIGSSEQLRYTITVRDFAALTIAGVADARLDQVSAGRLALRISGTGTIEASGSADELDLVINGAGSVWGQQLVSRLARVWIDGTGSATVAAQDTLDVTIAGVGTVAYSGSPTVTRTITGVGSVQGPEGR